MGKDELSQSYIKIHGPKILIDNIELCDFEVLETRVEGGHSISTVEVSVKCKGTMDSKLEFVGNSI